jgi:hypothetical protein
MSSDFQPILFPNERIAWELDIHEGVIHRHVKASYYITNLRIFALDRLENKLVISLKIADTDLVVMNRHASSNSVGMGMFHDGVYAGNRTGTSRSIGSLVFMNQGIERIRLDGIDDPEGVKNLLHDQERSQQTELESFKE